MVTTFWFPGSSGDYRQVVTPCRSVGHCIAVAACISAGHADVGRRIDQNRGGTSAHAERLADRDVVSSLLEHLDDRISNGRFHGQLVQAGLVRPKRTLEMRGRDPGPLECLV